MQYRTKTLYLINKKAIKTMIEIMQLNLELLGYKEKASEQNTGILYEKENIKVFLLNDQAKIEVEMANEKKLFGTWTYEGSFLLNLITLTNTLCITKS